jgi:hypothetical protein
MNYSYPLLIPLGQNSLYVYIIHVPLTAIGLTGLEDVWKV